MIEKRFVDKDGQPVAQITFTLPANIAADKIFLVGDFNDWNRSATPFTRDADGRWVVILDLELGRAYQFRYLVDGSSWLNDGQADAYVHNLHGSSNCVVITDPAFRPHESESF